jgi:hypothetical protein
MSELSDLEIVEKAGLRTARYATFKPEMGVPVRTSVGYPKFWRHGVLPHSRVASPTGVFRNPTLVSLTEQRVAYFQRLGDLRADLLAELADIARANPGQPLVLLCFEDVTKDECHRTWFAEWFQGTFDVPVTEVQP